MVGSIGSYGSASAMARPDPAQMASKLFFRLDSKGQGFIDRVPVRGVRSVSRSGRRVIVSGLAGERVRLRVQTG